MSADYPHLFSPLAIGSLLLKNRIVMAPMSTEMGDADGAVTPRMIAFYRERALGGVGLITVEYTCVGPETGRAYHHQLTLESRRNLDGHARLVRTVHDAGAKIFMQLQHSGQFANAKVLPDGMPAGPSDVFARRDPTRQLARALGEAEIEALIEAFGYTAELAVEAGYDGVELHGAHGYLLTQFLSPLGNFRVDRWGGDFEGRLRFPLAVVERVKRALGDRPLCYRVSADEFTPGGLTIEDMEAIAPRLVGAGVDMIHCSTGWGVGPAFATVVEPMSTHEGWRIPLARRLRDATGVPVTTVGQIRWPETAEAAIADGHADLVALGRPLLADPYWAEKSRTGRRGEIRPCTSCNWCLAAHNEEGGVGCAENPRTGAELDPPIDPSIGAGRRAVVIGGGPGGMSAALLLDSAGFATELHEARDRLGGGIVASATPPGKDKLFWYRDYLEERLRRSRVVVHLGSAVSSEAVIATRPDIVILAAGTRAYRLPIDGIDDPMVADAYDLLMGDGAPPTGEGAHVVVYGGGETGCETAEYMAHHGARVTLVTRSPASKLARSAERVYRTSLLGRINSEPAITVLDNSSLVAIGEGQVRIDGQHACTLAADRVYIAQGREPERGMADALIAAGIPCSIVGDSRKIGRIGDAVHTAYDAIMGLRAQYEHSPELAC